MGLLIELFKNCVASESMGNKVLRELDRRSVDSDNDRDRNNYFIKTSNS